MEDDQTTALPAPFSPRRLLRGLRSLRWRWSGGMARKQGRIRWSWVSAGLAQLLVPDLATGKFPHEVLMLFLENTPAINHILTAYIWDILGNLNNDYKLLTSRNVKVGFPTGVYFFSRLLSLLTAVAVNLLCGIMYYNQAVTESYRVMFTVSNVMITNCMACAVFRHTKFGYHFRVVTTSERLSRTAGSSIIMQRRPARSNTMLDGNQVTNVIEHAADDGMAFKKATV
ncbi:hypothetical protein DFH09DRAFT_1334847 [Mycena vulgaris]|nr:hypothetical protein DFH09DRAFT_1334847 [Mycena vulgaris]